MSEAAAHTPDVVRQAVRQAGLNVSNAFNALSPEQVRSFGPVWQVIGPVVIREATRLIQQYGPQAGRMLQEWLTNLFQPEPAPAPVPTPHV
jgi:hypothetical protein